MSSQNFLSDKMNFVKSFFHPAKWTWSHTIIAFAFTLLFFLMSAFYYMLTQEQRRNVDLKMYVDKNARLIEALDKKLDILINNTDGPRTSNSTGSKNP